MALLHQVCRKLVENGFTVNPLKREWSVKAAACVGHWLTPTGLKSLKKKVDAIIK